MGTGASQSVLAMAKLVQQRCIRVLGFLPELQHKQSGLDEKTPTFTYLTNKINYLGISFKSNTIEIDKLLQFCQMSFNQKKSLVRE